MLWRKEGRNSVPGSAAGFVPLAPSSASPRRPWPRPPLPASTGDLALLTHALAHGYPVGSVIHRVLSPFARAGGPPSSTAAVQVRASRLIALISDSRVRSTSCSRAMT
jgi:hypothetical protein